MYSEERLQAHVRSLNALREDVGRHQVMIDKMSAWMEANLTPPPVPPTTVVDARGVEIKVGDLVVYAALPPPGLLIGGGPQLTEGRVTALNWPGGTTLMRVRPSTDHPAYPDGYCIVPAAAYVLVKGSPR